MCFIRKKIFNPKVGRYVQFGPYEWRVLDKQGDSVLLITKTVIAKKPYHEEETDVTWETCSIRHWLNSDFFNEFSASVQAQIQTTKVINSDNEEYGTKGGNDTEDKFFLLSLEEAYRYFSDEEAEQHGDRVYPDRLAGANERARSQGLYESEYTTKEGTGACNWDLRSPGNRPSAAVAVDYDGFIATYGCSVSFPEGIRPAAWVRIYK